MKLKNFYVYYSILLILIVSVLIKIYNIHSLSFWVDEFIAGVKLFQSNSWNDFFSYFRAYQSDQFPLFHTIYYLALRYFPILFDDIEKLRYLSLFFSITNIILFYILGNLIFERKISVLATFLFAISPFHSLFAQLIRPYILFEFASISSILASILFMQKPSNLRGFLWTLTSLLLFLTHFMSILLIVIEIIFIVFVYTKETSKYYIRYSIINLFISFTFFVIFFFFTSHIYTKEDNLFMSIPPFSKWVVDLFADDAVLINEPFFFQGQKCSKINNYWMNEIVNIHLWFDAILVLLFLISLLMFIHHILLKVVLVNDSKSQQFNIKKFFLNLLTTKDKEVSISLFLIGVVIIPIVILTFISIFRPCLQPRYTLYSSLILYLFGAWFICKIEHKKLRNIFVAWFLVSYGYQNIISITAQKTTDYRSVTKVLKENKRYNESILSWGTFFYGPPLTNEMLAYHANLSKENITPVYSLSDMFNQVRIELIEKNNNSVWLMIDPFVFNFPKETIIEYFFNKTKVGYEKHFFPGMNGIFLYHLKKTSNTFNEPIQIPRLIDYSPFLEEISKISPPIEVQKKMIEFLPNCIDFNHPPTALIWFYIAWAFLDRNEPVLSEWSSKISISKLPHLPWGYYVLSISLAEQGKIDEAKETMKICLEKDTSNFIKKNYYPIFKSIYLDKSKILSREIIKQTESRGAIIPPIFYKHSVFAF